MENSFSLGLIHGALYGITPITPWFIGLKRYVLEGQTKGLITFGGIFLGQLLLLSLALFGGTELLWIWYYVEPALVIVGLVAMLRAFAVCWEPFERPTPLKTRRDGLVYLGTGILFALCNPGGLDFGNYFLNTVPTNTLSYLGGFILFYTLFAVGVLYVLCLSPIAQRFWGVWSIERMRNGIEPNLDLYSIRVRNLQKIAIGTMFVLSVQFMHMIPGSYGMYYLDTVFGGTPAQKILPGRDLEWIESDEEQPVAPVERKNGDDLTDDEELPEVTEIVKVWKLQSPFDLNSITDSDQEVALDEEGPWHTIHKYNTLNEKLEREELGPKLKMEELEYYDKGGPNRHYIKWLIKTVHPLRMMFKPDWDVTTEITETDWVQDLRKMRWEMDTLSDGTYPKTPLEMAFLPFSSGFEHDYDYDAVEIAKEVQVTEDDVISLNELRYGTDQKDTQASDFFDRKFDTYSRGTSGEDFSVVRLQDLPKQVQLPWDYPLVQAPNFSDAEVRFSPQQAPIDDLETKNKIQNKNIWFLDPVALNMRFLANNPLPETNERWTMKESELLKMKSFNTTRRLWMNETPGEGASGTEYTQESRSARDTLMGYVTSSTSKR